jgi:putative transposase
MGIKKFAALSNGRIYKPLNSFRKLENKLVVEQRKLSKKKKFSNNWKKQVRKVRAIHRKIANLRKDYLHKTSTEISKNHAFVVLEN